MFRASRRGIEVKRGVEIGPVNSGSEERGGALASAVLYVGSS